MDKDHQSLFQDDRYCICCGEKNHLGFQMKFRYEDEKLCSEVIIPKEFQGFANVVHGGMLGTVLDEMMVNLYWLKGIRVVSVEYQIRLKSPCPVNQTIFLSAWKVDIKKNVYFSASQACLKNGILVATGTAKCMSIE
jgi:acyl-coenzyme A thioesterase PaaI-like protein